MKCNIDEAGRRMRRRVGMVCLVIAGALLAAAAVWWHLAMLIVSSAFAAAGALCLWQARAGYCIVRGMGIRMRG